MFFTPTKLAGAFIIDVDKRCDERGFFGRTWCAEEFAAQGLDARPVQGSTSHNPVAGTLRGLHYQAAPYLDKKGIAFDPRGAKRVHPERNVVELGDGTTLAYELTVDGATSTPYSTHPYASGTPASDCPAP